VISAFGGWYDAMPLPPPDMPCVPACASGGIGLATMRFVGARCGIEPVTSAWFAFWEAKMSENRPESVQPAAPNPINEMATACGQKAVQRQARMVTRSYATNTGRH
jgi:hypothetical protein